MVAEGGDTVFNQVKAEINKKNKQKKIGEVLLRNIIRMFLRDFKSVYEVRIYTVKIAKNNKQMCLRDIS